MKFRALITEPPAMREFLNVAQSLSKFSKTCVLRITKKILYFIVSEEESGPRRPLVWCELPVSFYFKEFNVVGVSEKENEIYLELSTGLLARSCSILKQDVKSFKIKLTNKEAPCLTLEMELMSEELQSRHCVHDIPVEVISRKYWHDYQQPQFNEFHVSIQMPANLKSVKNIAEKMKNFAHSLTVSANKTGKLSLKIQTNTVKLDAHFNDLNVNSMLVDDYDENNEKIISSTIDVKKFIMFLSGMQLNNCRAVCNIVQSKMVKLAMEQPGALLLQMFLNELTV